MGAAVGQDCALLEEVCGWINEKATVPVWAKMTPNITDITQVGILDPCIWCLVDITSSFILGDRQGHGDVKCLLVISDSN